MNQIIDIINAKGDEGELKEIVEKSRTNFNKKQTDIPEQKISERDLGI